MPKKIDKQIYNQILNDPPKKTGNKKSISKINKNLI